MPNIKSAIKRVKTSEKRRVANKNKKTTLRTELKKLSVALEENAENVKDLASHAQKSIDRAAAKGLIHKNTAARKVAQIAKAVQK